MKYLLLISFLAVNLTNSQTVSFPLHIGDRWDYLGGGITARVQADTVMPDGQSYAEIVGLPLIHTTRYLREVGDSVFEYNGRFPGIRLVYDFTKHKGDTLYSVLGNYDLICTYYSVDSLFGRKLRTWVFAYLPQPLPSDGSDGETVVDSIGIASVFSADVEVFLSGAIIDGIPLGTITNIQPSINPLPQYFSLSRNYPNPFNPTTTIRYNIPEQSLVTLKVFDILGQEIATLVNETQNPGSKLTIFNANTMSNGVYYYTLSATNKNHSFTKTQSMLLLK